MLNQELISCIKISKLEIVIAFCVIIPKILMLLLVDWLPDCSMVDVHEQVVVVDVNRQLKHQ